MTYTGYTTVLPTLPSTIKAASPSAAASVSESPKVKDLREKLKALNEFDQSLDESIVELDANHAIVLEKHRQETKLVQDKLKHALVTHANKVISVVSTIPTKYAGTVKLPEMGEDPIKGIEELRKVVVDLRKQLQQARQAC